MYTYVELDEIEGGMAGLLKVFAVFSLDLPSALPGRALAATFERVRPLGDDITHLVTPGLKVRKEI